jgi:hypothetical protein
MNRSNEGSKGGPELQIAHYFFPFDSSAPLTSAKSFEETPGLERRYLVRGYVVGGIDLLLTSQLAAGHRPVLPQKPDQPLSLKISAVAACLVRVRN